MAASPGLHYSSSQSAPAQPSGVNHPAVSFFYEPANEGVYSGPDAYPANPATGVSGVASWTPTLGWNPVEESTTGYTVSRTSEPLPDIGLPPPPPFFQAGGLETYHGNLEHGNSEMETEETSFLLPPPPPVPHQGSGFQAGELMNYESIFEHGNEERETEEQGFMPLPPYAAAPQGAQLSAAASTFEGPVQPVSQELGSLGPNEYYLFLTGQLPPGTVSHFESDYEAGSDHWSEVHYEKYYPVSQEPTTTTQTQDVSRDGLWQQPQNSVKA
ncbi:uncharacterized protein [Chaetodon trifascialis]|uniref:uncharacterized protein n=1 Tax=Chaetodon trifascialis TaxID=109706 RepID=UPI0039954C14